MATLPCIVQSLLPWYRRQARDLPWRRTSDPYAIWVSEIMLQQTQVRTVIPYWLRWMRRFPTVRSLARAKEPAVLKCWEGLGYYTRARNLHRAAQIIVSRHQGEFPQSFDQIIMLPGIGRYTAGAICSIAYNQPAPVLDGNVTRVLSRIFGVSTDPKLSRTKERLWQLAERLVRCAEALPKRKNRRACSNLNQSLMELGATLCTPREARCPQCPCRRSCRACREDRVDDFPTTSARPKTLRRWVTAFVVAENGRFLVRQRPSGVVNAHLWEFPNRETKGRVTEVENLARQCLGFRPEATQPLCAIEHTITRNRIHLEVFSATKAGASIETIPGGRWCTLKQLSRLPFPSAHRKIVDALEAAAKRRSD